MKNTLIKISNNVQKFLIKNSSEILLGVGISGMLTSTGLAVTATYKAARIIDKEQEKRKKELETKEKFLLTWKLYICSAITAGVSAACLIGSNSINSERKAALTTAYILSETALKEYQQKTTEILGEQKDILIKDAIAKDKITQNPPYNLNGVYITSKGDTLCYDAVFGKYFKSDIDKIKKIENDINKRLRTDMYLTVNEFYYEMGLNPFDAGDHLGWHIDHEYLDIHFSAQLSEDEQPCLVLTYKIIPLV